MFTEYNGGMIQSIKQCDTGSVIGTCKIPAGVLDACSGINDTSFGYSDGKPCVFFKLNKVCEKYR